MKRWMAILLVPAIMQAQTSFVRGWYEVKPVPTVNFHNSERIFELLRGGQIYLSLADAIALAIENNLDIELERYLPQMAQTDLQRTKGGGLPRGLSLLVNETAPGIGGPNGPLLTTLTASPTPAPVVNTNFSSVALVTSQQNDLSVTGAIPPSAGSAIPQYDPIVSGALNWAHESTPEFNPALTGASNWLVGNDFSGNFGFTQGFSPGTQLSMAFDNTRLTSNAARYTYNPMLNSTLGFTITQPLLRGFGIEVNRRYIHIAKNNGKVAALVFKQQVIDTVAGVARLYTDLVSLNEDVNVKREALRLAQRLYEDNKNKIDEGQLAPIELTRARAQVAVSQQALISSQGLVEQQELIVKTAITRRGLANPAIRAAHIIPTDTLSVPESEPAGSVDNLIAEALRDRPDLAQAGIQVESAQLSLKGSLNVARPELDVVGTVQNGGLSGSLNAAALGLTSGATVYPGGYGTGLGQIFKNNFPTYSVGVQLILPLRNRVAQSDAVRDELQLRQTQIRRQQFEDQVRLEVADAYVAMQQAWAAYQAAVQSRVLQEESVKVEQDTFDVGLATNYQVIQYQTLLAQARSTEVAARGAFVKAKVALDRATANTLDVHHVSIDQVQSGRVSRSPAR
ncbi:MAG TPA: TolC family protein [Bryobacteraceae bacterium]|nr:TolC family protein [Dongiaceae bacterium]HVO99789.1 TolC family protein [Bryobacteraceae bacterium]